MTDAEINLAIAKIEYPELIIEHDGDLAVLNYPSGEVIFLDYCTSWADTGPIIERDNIDLHYEPMADGKDWHAASCGNIAEVWAETPTKAAALCYLRMKGIE